MASHNASFDIDFASLDMPPSLESYLHWVLAPGAGDIIPWFPRGGGFTIFDRDHYVPLDDVWDEAELAADVPDTVLQGCRGDDGSMYAVPVVAENQICTMRRSTMTGAGLTATPPATWTELLSLCHSLLDRGMAGLATDMEVFPASIMLDYLLVRMHGLEFYNQFSNGHVSFIDSRILASLDEYSVLLERGYFMPKPGSNRTLMASYLDFVHW